MPRKLFQTTRRNATFGKPELVDAAGREFKLPKPEFLAQFDADELRSSKILDMRLPKRVPAELRIPLPELDVKCTFFLPEVLAKKNRGNVVLPAARGTITELHMMKGSNCGLIVVEDWLWVGQAEDDFTNLNTGPRVRKLTPRVPLV